MRPSISPRVFWTRASIVLVALTAVHFVLQNIARVNTRSVPYHFVWIEGGRPGKGDFAIVSVRHPVIAPDGSQARITKQLVCVEGEYLSFDGEAWYCNGARLGERLRTTLSGEPLDPFVFDGLIPPGQGFVMGTSPYSFDSRYLGLVSTEHMVKVRGLF